MQNSTLYSVISFVGGAAISGLATWYFTKKKYEKIATDEIESVKAKFTVPRSSIVKTEPETKKDTAEKAKNKPNLVEYTKTLKEGGYINYSKQPEPEKSKSSGRYPWGKSKEDGNPYVIDPDEYGQNEDYEQVDLTLYADGILADNYGTIVEAVEVIGDALDHMGEYEDDAVHVCDDEREVYYEVLADERKYTDAVKKPHPSDDEEDE